MRLATQCPACSNPNINNLGIGSLAPFVAYRTGIDANLGTSCECPNCGLRFTRVRFDEEEIAALYKDYRGPTYNEERERFEPGYTATWGHLNDPRDSIPMIEQWVTNALGKPPANVLDIGGNDGRNTPFTNVATIWDVYDPRPTGTFDLVVMAHVLEHVPYPQHLVATARSFLSDSGIIFAELPIDPPVDGWHEHINQFNETSLRALFGTLLAFKEVNTSVGTVRMLLSR